MKKNVIKLFLIFLVLLNTKIFANSYYDQMDKCLSLISKHNNNCINLQKRWVDIMNSIKDEGYNLEKNDIYQKVNRGYQEFESESNIISTNLKMIESTIEASGIGGNVDVSQSLNTVNGKIGDFYTKWNTYLNSIVNNGFAEVQDDNKKTNKIIGHENVNGKIWKDGEYVDQTKDIIAPSNENEQDSHSDSNVYTPDKNSSSYQNTLNKQKKATAKIRAKKKKNK